MADAPEYTALGLEAAILQLQRAASSQFAAFVAALQMESTRATNTLVNADKDHIQAAQGAAQMMRMLLHRVEFAQERLEDHAREAAARASHRNRKTP